MSGNSSQRHKIKSKQGILLDLGSGTKKRPGFVRMDKNKSVHPDILHDLEKIPYPLKDESVMTLLAAHVVEHIKPWLMVDCMNEWWRILKTGSQMAIVMPYGYSDAFLSDPTHCNPRNEITWQYFDPRYGLYDIYRPNPWKIKMIAFQPNSHMEVLLEKISQKEVPKLDGSQSTS